MEVIPYLAGSRETEAVGAVVLHRQKDRHVGVYHDILDDPEGGSPLLGPGRLLTHDAVRDLALRLSGSGGMRTLLPESVLVADSDLLCWWRPATRRPIIFQTADKALNKEMSGRTVLHPSLLFAARPQKLAVYALTGGGVRPSLTTALCRAPYFNLYAIGSMCEGSVPLPAAPLPTEAVLSGYETAFYDSAFVHTNLGHGQLVNWPGGHTAFWREMKKATQFLEQVLVPLKTGGRPLTVGDVINARSHEMRVDPDPVTPAIPATSDSAIGEVNDALTRL